MKNIELITEALTISTDEAVSRLLKQFLLSNTISQQSKFDLYQFCDKPKGFRDTLKGVYFANGYKYATNGHYLVKVKESYIPEQEGKIIDKKGAIIEGTYPDCDSVIPKDENLTFIPIDWKRVGEIAKEYAIDLKSGKIESGYIEINEVCLHPELFGKLAVFASAYSITEIGIQDAGHAVKIGRGCEITGLLMPMCNLNKAHSGVKKYTLK